MGKARTRNNGTKAALVLDQMPRRCWECDLFFIVRAEYVCMGQKGGKNIDIKPATRPTHCPLIEVECDEE